MMEREKLLSNTALALTAQLSTRGALFVAGLVVAHKLGPEAFAAYSFLSITANAISIISAFGLGVSILRQFSLPPESLNSRDLADSRVLGSAVILCAAMPLVVLPFLPAQWLALPASTNLILLSLLTSSTVAGGLITSGMHGLENFRSVAVVSGGSALAILGTSILAAIANEGTFANWGLVLAHVLVVVSLGPAWFRRAFLVGRGPIDPKCYRQSLSDVFRGSVVIVATSACVSSGLWMAGRTTLATVEGAGQVQFALFGAGFQWFSLILLIPNVVTRVFQPTVVRHAIGEKVPSVEPQSPVITNLRIAAGAGALAFLLIALTSPLASVIYGKEFPNIAAIIVVYSLGGAVAAPVTVLGAAFLSFGKNAIWLKLMIFWLFALSAGLFMLSGHGAIGVGMAITFAYAATVWPAFATASRFGVLSSNQSAPKQRGE